MRLYFYLLDADGRRVMATPVRAWPNNRPSLKELDAAMLDIPHYAKVRADAEHFSARGARAALIYEINTTGSNQPDLLATLWLNGPFALQSE